MTPRELANALRRIAQAIQNSEHPSRSRVASDLKSLMVRIADYRSDEAGKVIENVDLIRDTIIRICGQMGIDCSYFEKADDIGNMIEGLTMVLGPIRRKSDGPEKSAAIKEIESLMEPAAELKSTGAGGFYGVINDFIRRVRGLSDGQSSSYRPSDSVGAHLNEFDKAGLRHKLVEAAKLIEDANLKTKYTEEFKRLHLDDINAAVSSVMSAIDKMVKSFEIAAAQELIYTLRDIGVDDNQLNLQEKNIDMYIKEFVDEEEGDFGESLEERAEGEEVTAKFVQNLMSALEGHDLKGSISGGSGGIYKTMVEKKRNLPEIEQMLLEPLTASEQMQLVRELKKAAELIEDPALLAEVRKMPTKVDDRFECSKMMRTLLEKTKRGGETDAFNKYKEIVRGVILYPEFERVLHRYLK